MRFKSLFLSFWSNEHLNIIISLRFDFIPCGQINVLTDKAEKAINVVESVYFTFIRAYEKCQI